MGPRPWIATQEPGPCGGTLGWDPKVGQQRLFFKKIYFLYVFSLSELQEVQTHL